MLMRPPLQVAYLAGERKRVTYQRHAIPNFQRGQVNNNEGFEDEGDLHKGDIA